MEQYIHVLVETSLLALTLTILVLTMEQIFNRIRNFKNSLNAVIQQKDAEIQALREQVANFEAQGDKTAEMTSFLDSEGIA